MVDLQLYIGIYYDNVATTRLDAIMTKLILLVSMCVSNLEDICSLVFIPFAQLIKLGCHLGAWVYGFHVVFGWLGQGVQGFESSFMEHEQGEVFDGQ